LLPIEGTPLNRVSILLRCRPFVVVDSSFLSLLLSYSFSLQNKILRDTTVQISTSGVKK
jgi:hypothetical protein